MKVQKSIMMMCVGLMVLMLTGCEWFCKKCDKTTDCNVLSSREEKSVGSGQVLLTIQGKPAITSDEFETYLNQIMTENPQVKAIIEAIPDARYNLFSGMVADEILIEWARDNNICESDTYKKEYAFALKMLGRQLIQKSFQESLMKNISVSEKDAKKYYEEHKAVMPELQISPATEEKGVKKEASYRPFNEIKDDLIKMLEREKVNELYMKEVEVLKKRYDAQEDGSYFNKGHIPELEVEMLKEEDLGALSSTQEKNSELVNHEQRKDASRVA